MFRRQPTGQRSRDRAFLWPVFLIVPPVIILAFIALYSMRQDQAAIERDARRSGGLLAADLARRWSARAEKELTALVSSGCSGTGLNVSLHTSDAPSAALCALVVDGRIRVPVDYAPLPSPPAWVRELTPAQARLLRLAGDSSAQADPAARRRAAASLGEGAPAALRVNAEWSLVRSENRRGDSQATVSRFADLARRSAGIATDSGTPISDLALLMALRHLTPGGQSEPLLRDLREHVLEAPSFLTAALVEQAVRADPGNRSALTIEARWAANEYALSLVRRVPLDARRPGEIWLDSDRGAWLALVHPLIADEAVSAAPRTAFHVTLLPARLVERLFTATASDQVPAYAAAVVRMGGRTSRGASSIPTPSELGAGEGQFHVPLALPSDMVSAFAGELLRVAPQAIASRQEMPSGVVRLNGVPGAHPFTVTLELASRERLYAAYRTRLWTAVALVLAATCAAFGGLTATWRAFARQRRLSEMKSNFVASVSHELRAPVAAVRLMAESLERGTVEAAQRRQEYLRVIGQECRRLSSLVENVLDFSRLERGRRQYNFEPADLRAVVEQAVEVMRPYAAERQVGLVSAVPPGNAEISHPRVDRVALQQALVNLVDNAVKHSPPGAEVHVGLQCDEATPRAIRLSVEDCGPGIPAGEQEQIFEPFYRRGSELRRETPGIGIGLAIVKHTAEAHGGRASVVSIPGRGSRFTIEIPLPPEMAR